MTSTRDSRQMETRMKYCRAFIMAELRRIRRRKPATTRPGVLAVRADRLAVQRGVEIAHISVPRETIAHISASEKEPLARPIKREKIAQMLHVSRDWLYRNLYEMQSRLDFPLPIKRPGRAVWDRAAVEAWDASGKGDDFLRRARHAHKKTAGAA